MSPTVPLETAPYLRALKDGYVETAELMADNLQLIEAVFNARPSGDANLTFNWGLQLGAMLERTQGDLRPIMTAGELRAIPIPTLPDECLAALRAASEMGAEPGLWIRSRRWLCGLFRRLRVWCTT